MAIPDFTYQPNYSVDTKPFESASSALTQASSMAAPSQAAYDTAAARIRSRLEGKQRGDERKALDVFGRSGNVGQYGQQFRQARQDAQSNLASGLADLEENFWNAQREGASTLANIGSQFANIGTQKGEAQRAGEQLNLDASRTNANTFNNLLSTIGQSGGVLSLFQNANASNPNFSQPFNQFFGEGFKFPNANEIANFTNSSLAGTGTTVNVGGTGGGATVGNPPGTTVGDAIGPNSQIKQSDYTMAAGLFFRPDGSPRLQLRNNRLYDPDSGLYVMSDAEYQRQVKEGWNPRLIYGIPFYTLPGEGTGSGTFPAEG